MPDNPYFFIANMANGASSGLEGFAQMTKEDWEALLHGEWSPHFAEIGGPIAALWNWVNAIGSAFQGDFAPLEALLGSVIDGFEASFDDLKDAFEGTYTGDDDALHTISGIIATLRSLASGKIDASRITSLFIGNITNANPPNLLDNGGFAGAISMLDDDAVWVWDDTEGHDSAGSAKTTGASALRVLTSNLVPVTPGDVLDVAGWVKWSGCSGSGSGFELQVRAFSGASIVSTTTVAHQDVSASGGWTQLSDSYTVPSGADGVRVRIVVTANVSAGSVWWDDVSCKQTATTLPQAWVAGLTSALSNLGDWIENLVTQIGTNLGLSLSGSLLDKIGSVATEFGSWLEDHEDRAAQLTDLIGDLLSAPATVIGTLPKANVADLVDDLADIPDKIFQGASNALSETGKTLEDARDALLDLFGLADLARQIATTAQSQVQDITNDTEAPAELNGLVWSTVFAGADNTAIPSGDWSASNVVIKGNQAGVADGAANNSISWAVTDQEFTTDGHSASVVLGSPRGKTGFYDCYTGLYVRVNLDFTQAAYCHVRKNGGINVGKMTRSGSTFTFTQLATVSVGVLEGDLVRFRCYGANYYVVVNGITRLSFTDSGAVISSGAGFRHAAFSMQRKEFSDFFSTWTNDAYRVASFAMSDWVPAGVTVTTASWRLRRGSGSEVALSVTHGAQAVMPSSFYTVDDLSEQVTVVDLGTGQVEIEEGGWYEITAASINRDNMNETATIPFGVVADAWRASMWVLYVDGAAIAGPITSGVSVTVYLDAGQVVRPGVSASNPVFPVSYLTNSDRARAAR